MYTNFLGNNIMYIVKDFKCSMSQCAYIPALDTVAMNMKSTCLGF